MGEQVAASGLLPLQRIAQKRRIDAQQHQSRLPGPVLGGAGGDLGRGRKMDEAVGGILVRAVVDPFGLGGRLFGVGALVIFGRGGIYHSSFSGPSMVSSSPSATVIASP